MQATDKTKETQTTQQKTMYRILVIISLAHLLNDTVQSLVPAMFPVLKESIGLTYTQLGVLAFALNLTSSLIQPIVGVYTDKKPSPYALPIGLCFTFLGVLGIALAPSFATIILAVTFIGLGSATFHPEGSRVAYMAAGPRRGFAQSTFQVGGNTGQALAPLITALILVPLGQFGAIWFTFVAAIAIILLFYIARWYSEQVKLQAEREKVSPVKKREALPKAYRKKIILAMVLLIFFVFARTLFHTGIVSFYAFYIMDEYSLSIQQAQIYLFIFLAAGAVGTFIGGPLADRFGRKIVIMGSMLFSAPFTLVLPYVNKVIAYPLITVVGFIVLCSFSVSVVYAQELVPGRIGLVSGLVMGLGFGIGAVGAIFFGSMADAIGITNTIKLITFLPFIGLTLLFLPSDKWVEEHIK